MSKRTTATLNGLVEEFLLERGAVSVGVATIETLAGGPPSTDLEYCLEGGRSASYIPFRRKMQRILSRRWSPSAGRFTADAGGPVLPLAPDMPELTERI